MSINYIFDFRLLKLEVAKLVHFVFRYVLFICLSHLFFRFYKLSMSQCSLKSLKLHMTYKEGKVIYIDFLQLPYLNLKS